MISDVPNHLTLDSWDAPWNDFDAEDGIEECEPDPDADDGFEIDEP